MTDEELKQIEDMIKKHKQDDIGAFLVTALFLCFLQGCFKGCGY